MKKGFTLVELIVVIGILAILAGILLTIVNPAEQFQKANDGKRKADIAQIQRALEQYYQDQGKYPAQSGYQIVDFKTSQPITWGKSWQPYMNLTPKDPSSGKSYVYYVSADKQTYWLYASLDRGSKDPQVCNNGNICQAYMNNSIPGSPCGAGVVCNYGVSSPNTTP